MTQLHNVVALAIALVFPLQSCKACESECIARSARSCLDLLQRGVKTSGHYQIFDQSNDRFINVYCDMESEPGSAWTLVESFALKNKGVDQVQRHAIQTNVPVNEKTPNWNIYRMSLSQMTFLKAQSTHWRVTCSLPTFGVDYRDYARANFADFDIMTFLGDGVCKKMEFVNIRGHQCAQCTATWWQKLNTYPATIDSSYPNNCQFVATAGCVPSEDNFGFYHAINNNFRCSSGADSTTNWWFGGYL